MTVTTATVLLAIVIQLACGRVLTESAITPACRVVQQAEQVEMHSPHFVFRLDTTSGLRAQSWENRLSGRTLSLGNAAELEFDIGLPDGPLTTPQLEVLKAEVKALVRLQAVRA